MKFEASHVYHVYNQGNNKQRLFKSDEDYKQFISLITSYIVPYADIIAWCLMPNHFHLMLVVNKQGATPHQQGGITIDLLTNGFRKLTSAYAHDFNKRNNKSGAVFRPKTKAKDLTDLQFNESRIANHYYINCFYYIHQNPLRHHLVKDLSAWQYSSFNFYSGERKNDICNKELATQISDYSEASFVQDVYNRLPDEFFDSVDKE